VKPGLQFIRWTMLVVALGAYAWAQSNEGQEEPRKHEPGPGRQIGSGAGNIGLGAARGAGDLAVGTAKAAGSLVTLHPIDAGVSLGKGAGEATKDVTVGTVKGTGKITKGVGRAVKKIF